MSRLSSALVWFRNDLRAIDNEALFRACRHQDRVIALYCFDPRQFSTTDFDFPTTGAFRLQFLLESLTDLKRQLKELNIPLLIRSDYPEKAIPQIIEELDIDVVYMHSEVTSEEKQVEKKLQRALPSTIALRKLHGAFLYHPEDIPFTPSGIPDIYTSFRKSVEKQARVRDCFALPKPQDESEIQSDTIPDFASFDVPQPPEDKRSAFPFSGGASAALERMQSYFWEDHHLRRYKETRNGLVGTSYSSKFSAWLANGSISPRQIYWEVQKYEQQVVSNSSTYWLVFELIWRDYFRYVAMKYRNAIFWKGGIRNQPPSMRANDSVFEQWRLGETGEPFVDANMLELLHSGWMSNRGRQNVASYLVKDLKQDWRRGASWFESQLLDYDPCSNWGNWMYVAGVGNDPRENRYFNVRKQAQRYDPNGEFVRLWLKDRVDV